MSAAKKPATTDPSEEGSVAVKEASTEVETESVGADVSISVVPDEPAVLPSDRIDPVSGTATLADGTVVKVSALKTREFLKMMRIVTRGGANVMSTVVLNFSGDVDQFTSQLVAVTLFAIPEAEEETIDFVRTMVSPSLTGTREEVKAESERLDAYMENPELDDLITIVEAVVRREASDLKALGKRLQAMMKIAEKVGEVPAELKSV